MRLSALKKAMALTLLSSLVMWSFLGVSEKEISTVGHRRDSSSFVRYLEASENQPLLDGNLTSQAEHMSLSNDHMHHITIPLRGRTIVPTKSKPPHRRHTVHTSTRRVLDPKEQLRLEIYGNNYLEELVLVGASNEVLYEEVARRRQSGKCSKWNGEMLCSDEPLLNLLRKGFRYFELTADFDPDTRFYYWHADRDYDVQRREMSKDIRAICPFARNHSGEMFIFSLSFCSSRCNDQETLDYDQQTDQSMSIPSGPSKWTNFLRAMPESIVTSQTRLSNRTSFANPSYSSQKLGIIDKWFSSSDKPLVENPIASRFLSIVSSYVKSCTLLADVPLTRTVSEMLMLRRNVIFTVRSPDFLIPLVLQRVFRHDEILRKTLWSTADSLRRTRRASRQRLHIDELFPVLEETKNFRFFTQPSTLSHLRLVFSESHDDLPWFSRWKGVMIFPSGCTVFDVSLMLLMACLILMVLKSSLRRSTLSSMRYDPSVGKVYPLKKSSSSLSLTLKSSQPSSVVMLYLLYAIFFACFLLANLYAYQCFPRVILPFSHREVDQSLIQSHNLSFGEKNIEGLSNKTSVGFPASLLIIGSNEELCNTLVWMFRRWLGRPYGKRVNIISAVARSFSSPSTPHYVNDPQLNNLSSQEPNESDICTNEFVEFAEEVNYNQLRKHLLLRHSGAPVPGWKTALRETPDLACRPVAFSYSVSTTSGKDLVSGLLDEDDEIILEDGTFPRNSMLNIFVLTRNMSMLALYSESLDRLLKAQTDLYLRGTGFGSTSDSGFAYVSNRSDMTSPSCHKKDLPRSPDLLRFTSWLN